MDGDIVSAVPGSGYKHIGTNVIIDSIGAGSVIIDPSFVEKFLRMRSKVSVGAHSLNAYRCGLLGVKYATEFLTGQVDEIQQSEAREDEENGVTLSQRSIRSSSTLSVDMRRAQQSGIFARQRASLLATQAMDPHNEGVTHADEWAAQLQSETFVEKMFKLLGWNAEVKLTVENSHQLTNETEAQSNHLENNDHQTQPNPLGHADHQMDATESKST